MDLGFELKDVTCLPVKEHITTTYISAKWIESGSNPASESSRNFAENMEDRRRACWSAPWVCNQQNPDYGKVYRSNSPSLQQKHKKKKEIEES